MVIYRTTNIINGKWYIGKDAKNSKTYLGSGIAIKNAIEKYGKENFHKEILEYCSSLEELSEKEKEWIKNTGAIENPNSYNLADRGVGGNLEKFKRREKKYKHSEETKEKIKKSVSGHKNGMYAKRMSKESREKISRSHSGRKMPERSVEHRKNISESLTGRSLKRSHIEAILDGRKNGKPKNGNRVLAKSEKETLKFISVAKAAIYFNCSRNRILRNQVKNFKIEIEKKNGTV